MVTCWGYLAKLNGTTGEVFWSVQSFAKNSLEIPEKTAQAFASTGEQWLSYVRTVMAPKFPQGIQDDVQRLLGRR